MNALTVAVKVDARDLQSTAEVIASLPVSVTVTMTDPADLVVLSGGPGWTRVASNEVRGGARGVVVIRPTAESTSELLDVARSHGAPVVLAHRWASNAALPLAQSELRASNGGISFADLSATVESSADFPAALDELRLIASGLLGPIDDLEYLASNEMTLLATSHVSDETTPVTFTVLRTPAGAYPVSARIVAATGSIELQIPDPTTAAPATLSSTTDAGLTINPLVFETSQRSAWRTAIRLVRSGGRSDDLLAWSDSV